MKEFCFIILRHVSKPIQNKLWINCYRQIRKFYQAHIVIIDDNSKRGILNKSIELKNCTVIQSEFPGRGEILPYYYMFTRKLCKRALILHDSTFIIRRLPIGKYTRSVQPLWIAGHAYNRPNLEKKLIRRYLHKSKELIRFYNNKKQWNLFFGGMSMVTLPFIRKIQNKYNVFGLLSVMKNRNHRMAFERIIGMLAYKETPNLRSVGSIFGNIHRNGHFPFRYSIGAFLRDKGNDFRNIPNRKKILKCWVGR